MKVERIREKDGKLELLVQLTPAETSQEIQRAALAALQKKGFDFDPSTGAAPSEVLEERLGRVESAFTIDELVMHRRAPFALTAAQIDCIGSPVYRCPDHAIEGRPFKYQLVCVPVPLYELNDYSPVVIDIPSRAAADEEVAEEIARMAKAFPDVATDTSHAIVRKGDRVEISMETTMGGKKVPALCFKGREYATGAQTMPDDFDEAVIGMQVGERKSFTFAGPDREFDADGNLLFDEYETTVVCKRIVKTSAPKMGDAWAKSIMPDVADFAEFKERVRQKVQARIDAECARTAEDNAARALAERLDASIPDLVYGVAVKEAKTAFDGFLRKRGITQEQYLKQEGITAEQLSHSLMLQVREQLSCQFALDAYAAHFDVVVQDGDLDAYFESIAPGKANLAHADFKEDGRMYAAMCAARRLKAARRAVREAEVSS